MPPPDDRSPGPTGPVVEVRAVFVEAWVKAVAGTSYVCLPVDELTAYLGGLTDRLIGIVTAPSEDPTAADGLGAELGAELVARHFTDPTTLGRTLALLSEELPTLAAAVGGPAPPDLRRRVAAVIGAVATGYTTALRELTLSEQDQIYQALLTARRHAEHGLAVSEARFRAMFLESAIGIGIGDLSGNILDVNPALLKMFGYTAAEFAQRTVAEMMHPDDAPSVWESYGQLIAGRLEEFRVEKRFFRADGAVIWTNLTVSLVRDETGAPAFQVAMLEDITERRHLHASLEHQAFHDSLTGLPNRAQFTQRLHAEFAHPSPDRRIGLCYLDLDGFKTINDTLGHDLGDQLLTAVAARLSRCCGPNQLVSRMGGDEFVILVHDTTGIDEVIAVAQDIHTALAAPFRLGPHELVITTSIGIVERPVRAITPADLMSAADITLYWAKDEGKNRYAVFDQDRTDDHITRFTLSSTLTAALTRGEFVLDYQPLMSLTDATQHAVEALVRWEHPTYGRLGPDTFIPLAEETGAIVALGRWVLARACAQAQHWYAEFGDRAPIMSVNLSPRQLQDPGLLEDVTTILTDTGLPAELLQLELTEQAVMADDTASLRALDALHDIGVRIVIDDFGTGYSNMSYLHRLPLHGLKLDASFIQGLHHDAEPDPPGAVIVSALIALAHALDLTITAEGVETTPQLARLTALGCDTAQGWLFAHPGPPEQITTSLRRTQLTTPRNPPLRLDRQQRQHEEHQHPGRGRRPTDRGDSPRTSG